MTSSTSSKIVFSTEACPNAAPSLVSISPLDGATEVSSGSDITFTFDENIQLSNSGNDYVKVNGSISGNKYYSFSSPDLSVSSDTLVITNNSFVPGETITIEIFGSNGLVSDSQGAMWDGSLNSVNGSDNIYSL